MTKQIAIEGRSMKKIVTFTIVLMMLFLLVACSNSEGHEGEAKTPSGSGVQKGRDYQSVVEDFEEHGFTNISLVELNDLITGWITKDGEVESVSVDGDADYSADKWYPNDVEVVITYHTFAEDADDESTESKEQNDISKEPTNKGVEETISESETILTIETCTDLKTLLSIDGEINDFYSEFAETYKGLIISFEGCITYVTNHDDYDTRYDIMISGGDYVDNGTSNLGPVFKFENVNVSNLGINDLFLPDFVKVGTNIQITAMVQNFNSETGLFFLKPVLIEER